MEGKAKTKSYNLTGTITMMATYPVNSTFVSSCCARLLVGLLLLAAWTAPGATYYVDGNGGNNSSNGLSWAAAKKTITGATSLITSNSQNTLYVRGDWVYREPNYASSIYSGLSDTQRIVFAGVAGTNSGVMPIVSGAGDADESAFAATNGFTNVYWITTNTAPLSGWLWGSPRGQDRWTFYSQKTSIDAVNTSPASFYHAAGTTNKLYLHTDDGSNPTNYDIEPARIAYGIYFAAVSNITVQGFRIRHVCNYGYYLNYSDYMTITDCVVYANNLGIYFRGYSTDRTPGSKVLGCEIFNNAATGIDADYNDNLVIQNSGIRSNATGGLSYYALNIINSRNAAIGRNTIATNRYRAVLFNATDGMQFYDNDIRGNNGYAVFLSQATNSALYHNSFYNNGNGIYFDGTTASTNCTIFNNIIWANGSGTYCIRMNAASEPGFQSDYNDLFTNDAAVVGSWGGTDRATLAAWQSASAGDSNSISQDPLFTDTNAASPNLHLRRSTPCAERGASSFNGYTPAGVDRDGRPRPSRYMLLLDMGCYEYVPPLTMFTVW